MTGIILASHGGLAEGVKQSAGMVFGPQEDLVAVTLLPEDGPDSFRAKLEAAVNTLSNKEEVLFLVDLLGGTPFNQSSAVLKGHEDKWAIVTGLSLPMLIGALGERMGDENMPAHEIAKNIIAPSREAVSVMPESLEPAPVQAAATAAAPTGAIPPGTVLGDGHIKYVLARVDSRLLHGQVATAWTKSVKPDRIIVVSDAVSKDELRKGLITKAAPPGVKAHVIPLKKLTLNIGSMAHSVGKVLVNKVISMGKEDVATFKELEQLGIKFDVRKVPADGQDNLDALLQKAEAELK